MRPNSPQRRPLASRARVNSFAIQLALAALLAGVMILGYATTSGILAPDAADPCDRNPPHTHTMDTPTQFTTPHTPHSTTHTTHHTPPPPHHTQPPTHTHTQLDQLTTTQYHSTTPPHHHTHHHTTTSYHHTIPPHHTTTPYHHTIPPHHTTTPRVWWPIQQACRVSPHVLRLTTPAPCRATRLTPPEPRPPNQIFI